MTIKQVQVLAKQYRACLGVKEDQPMVGLLFLKRPSFFPPVQFIIESHLPRSLVHSTWQELYAQEC